MIKHRNPEIQVFLDDISICKINKNQIPCEKRISKPISKYESKLIFRDRYERNYIHQLNHEEGWIHISVRLQKNYACQIDCIITKEKKYDKNGFSNGKIDGIRFQPFFITYTGVENKNLIGKGLFDRGLHFSGFVSPGNLSLSCICDQCQKNFRIKSFHAGFSNLNYFYSDSGLQTLVISNYHEEAPSVLAEPDYEKLKNLEKKLPKAKDGTSFKYFNSFRCPHCSAPYIDFEKFPEQRKSEYYGNYFYEDEILRVDDL